MADLHITVNGEERRVVGLHHDDGTGFERVDGHVHDGIDWQLFTGPPFADPGTEGLMVSFDAYADIDDLSASWTAEGGDYSAYTIDTSSPIGATESTNTLRGSSGNVLHGDEDRHQTSSGNSYTVYFRTGDSDWNLSYYFNSQSTSYHFAGAYFLDVDQDGWSMFEMHDGGSEMALGGTLTFPSNTELKALVELDGPDDDYRVNVEFYGADEDIETTDPFAQDWGYPTDPTSIESGHFAIATGTSNDVWFGEVHRGEADVDEEIPSPADVWITDSSASSLTVDWTEVETEGSGAEGMLHYDARKYDATAAIDHYNVYVDGSYDHSADAPPSTVTDLEEETVYEIGVTAVSGSSESDMTTVLAETDPAQVVEAPVQDGLVGHYDGLTMDASSGDTVWEMVDHANTARVTANSSSDTGTYSEDGINGHGAVIVDGSKFDAEYNTALTQPYSIFAAVRARTTSTLDDQYIVGKVNWDGGWATNVSLHLREDTNGSPRLAVGGSAITDTAQDADTINGDVIGGVANGSSSRLYWNSREYSGSVGSQSFGGPSIGTSGYSDFGQANALIGEVLIYDRAVSSAEASEIADYLDQRWGINKR